MDAKDLKSIKQIADVERNKVPINVVFSNGMEYIITYVGFDRAFIIRVADGHEGVCNVLLEEWELRPDKNIPCPFCGCEVLPFGNGLDNDKNPVAQVKHPINEKDNCPLNILVFKRRKWNERQYPEDINEN